MSKIQTKMTTTEMTGTVMTATKMTATVMSPTLMTATKMTGHGLFPIWKHLAHFLNNKNTVKQLNGRNLVLCKSLKTH